MTAGVGLASLCGFLTVSATPAAATTTPTTTSLPVVPAAVGVPSRMTATIVPNGSGTNQITGTVDFEDGGITISGCGTAQVFANGTGVNGEAQCDITYASTGTNDITAVYSGDSNWGGSTSPIAAENVLLPATVSASAPATAMLNQSVQLSTTVSGSGATPTGSVLLTDAGNNTICTITLSGGAGHCNHTFTQAGSQTITADYQGNSTYANSTGSSSFGSATIDVQKLA
jgi:hypothetical protein